MSEAAAPHPRPPAGVQNSSCPSNLQLGAQHRGHTPHPRPPRASEQSSVSQAIPSLPPPSLGALSAAEPGSF